MMAMLTADPDDAELLVIDAEEDAWRRKVSSRAGRRRAITESPDGLERSQEVSVRGLCWTAAMTVAHGRESRARFRGVEARCPRGPPAR